MPPMIHKDKCIGCHTCVSICPCDVYGRQEKNGVPKIQFADECWHCNACVLDCPAKAIELRIPAPCWMVYIDAPNATQN